MAITVLALGFTLASQLFSGSLRLAGINQRYNDAIAFADSKMADMVNSEDIPGANGYVNSGRFKKGFLWEARVTPYDDFQVEDAANFPFMIYRLEVTVRWIEDGRRREVFLDSLKCYSRMGRS